MKKLILLIIIALTANFANAQWQQTNGPYGGNINCIASDGTNIFAGTYGNGIWKRALSEMGVEENNFKTNITLYPNPANNKVTIINNNEPAKETTISIFNVQGELILSEKFKEQNAIELDISKFARGIYMLKIQIGNESDSYQIVNKKLVIQNEI